MKLITQFVGVEPFSNHLEFVKAESSTYIGKFERAREIVCNVVIKQSSHRSNFSNSKFECEIRVTGNNLKKIYFFKKLSDDFYDSIRKAMRAAEKALRRESKLRLSRKRKQFEKINRGLWIPNDESFC